mmetsp:Transcript_2190/g.5827  ORF Transcript_2190/g.5827 Transcript_2190/m.5827 type:complete len:242 (-) Transcript_2190:340-1065(-)
MDDFLVGNFMVFPTKGGKLAPELSSDFAAGAPGWRQLEKEPLAGTSSSIGCSEEEPNLLDVRPSSVLRPILLLLLLLPLLLLLLPLRQAVSPDGPAPPNVDSRQSVHRRPPPLLGQQRHHGTDHRDQGQVFRNPHLVQRRLAQQRSPVGFGQVFQRRRKEGRRADKDRQPRQNDDPLVTEAFQRVAQVRGSAPGGGNVVFAVQDPDGTPHPDLRQSGKEAVPGLVGLVQCRGHGALWRRNG